MRLAGTFGKHASPHYEIRTHLIMRTMLISLLSHSENHASLLVEGHVFHAIKLYDKRGHEYI